MVLTRRRPPRKRKKSEKVAVKKYPNVADAMRRAYILDDMRPAKTIEKRPRK